MTILTICLVLAVAAYLAPGYTATAAAVLAVLLHPELAAQALGAGLAAVVVIGAAVIWHELRRSGGLLLVRAGHAG